MQGKSVHLRSKCLLLAMLECNRSGTALAMVGRWEDTSREEPLSALAVEPRFIHCSPRTFTARLCRLPATLGIARPPFRLQFPGLVFFIQRPIQDRSCQGESLVPVISEEHGSAWPGTGRLEHIFLQSASLAKCVDWSRSYSRPRG